MSWKYGGIILISSLLVLGIYFISGVPPERVNAQVNSTDECPGAKILYNTGYACSFDSEITGPGGDPISIYRCSGGGTQTVSCKKWSEYGPTIRNYIGNDPADKCYAAVSGASSCTNGTYSCTLSDSVNTKYEYCGTQSGSGPGSTPPPTECGTVTCSGEFSRIQGYADSSYALPRYPQYNSNTTAVKDLQNAVSTIGYGSNICSGDGIDGYYGGDTALDLKALKQAEGLGSNGNDCNGDCWQGLETLLNDKYNCEVIADKTVVVNAKVEGQGDITAGVTNTATSQNSTGYTITDATEYPDSNRIGFTAANEVPVPGYKFIRYVVNGVEYRPLWDTTLDAGSCSGGDCGVSVVNSSPNATLTSHYGDLQLALASLPTPGADFSLNTGEALNVQATATKRGLGFSGTYDFHFWKNCTETSDNLSNNITSCGTDPSNYTLVSGVGDTLGSSHSETRSFTYNTPGSYRMKAIATITSNPNFSAAKWVDVSVATAVPDCSITEQTARPNPIDYGETTVIDWKCNNGTSCSTTGGSDSWTGDGPQVSSALTADTTYTTTCISEAGAVNPTVNSSITVDVGDAPPVPTADIQAKVNGDGRGGYSDGPVYFISNEEPDSSAELGHVKWSSTNATSCNISPDDYAKGSTSGTDLDTIPLTTTKTLTLSCEGDPIYDPAVDTIQFVESQLDFDIAPSSIADPQNVSVSWNSNAPNGCTLSPNPTGMPVAEDGSDSVYVDQQTTFDLTCDWGVFELERELTILVDPTLTFGGGGSGQSEEGYACYDLNWTMSSINIADCSVSGTSPVNSDFTSAFNTWKSGISDPFSGTGSAIICPTESTTFEIDCQCGIDCVRTWSSNTFIEEINPGAQSNFFDFLRRLLPGNIITDIGYAY